jgi:MFS family permease
MKNIFSGDAFAVMRVNGFRFFLFYRFFITCATLMQSVVVGWHLYSLTKSVLILGFIGLTEVIPQVSIALFAGHFVDKWDRRKIIAYTSSLLLVGSAILVIYCIPSLNCYARFGILPIFITIFLTGLTRGILLPAHTALLGQIVPRELYTNAATWNSANWQIAAVSGPAIGGLIYGFMGIIPAYSAVFIFYSIACILIFGIASPGPPIRKDTQENIFVSIGQGINFVFKNQILLGAMALDMFAVLFGGAVAMLPAFASDILKTGPQGLGLLRSAPAMGAILISFFLAFYPPVKRTGHLLLLCVTGFGITMICFALSKDFPLTFALLFMSGVFDNVSVVIRGTLVQVFTPDYMKGRVASVNSIFIGSSNEFGAFESGLAARLMGLVPSVIFGGIVTLLVVAVSAKFAPVLRKLSLKDKTETI